jgi:hypothetical protein
MVLKMTTTTTTTNNTLFVGGTTMITTNRKEFVAFVMDKTSGMTVADIKSELTKLSVSFPSKAKKEVLAGMLFDALEVLTAEVEAASAAGETLVAEENQTNNIEEEKEMTNEQTVAKELMEAQKRQNQKAMDNSRILKKEMAIRVSDHGYVNPISAKVNAQIKEMVARYFANLGEFRVEILRYVPVQNDRFNRVGYVDVQFPANYASLWFWNDLEKRREWYDFVEFNYNQMVGREKWSLPWNPAGMIHNVELGTGIIRLGVRKDANGELYVRLPMDKMKDGGFSDVFRTSDIRWGRANSANNGNIEAALTAAIRFYAQTLKMENPENRNDFDASCMNCRNMTWFGMKDGVDDDLHIAVGADEITDNPKSTRILNQPDVETLAQHGSHITQAYCTKKKFFVDAEAVEMINKLTQEERRYYDVEVIDPITGEVRIEQRFQGRDEVIVAGKAVKIRDIRVESTRETCRTCPFYHKNAYKGENQVGNEIVEAREKLAEKATTESAKSAARKAKVYVNEYWTTRARAGRQSFETNIDGQWIPGFPAQVTDDMNKVYDIRVAGIGVNVYFGDAMNAAMSNQDLAFLPGVEEFNAVEAAFNRMVNVIYYAAFNRDKMSKSKFEDVLTLIYVQGKPEGLTERQSERWDTAVHWFEESLEWAKQREAAKNRPDFAKKFFAGIDGYMAAKGLTEAPDLMALGVREVHIEDVLFETINRVVKGSLKDGYEKMFEDFHLEKGYEDLEPKDFIRFLDDKAMDYVLDCLADGNEYVVVGGKKDIEMDDEEKYAIEYFGAEDQYKKVKVEEDAGLVADTLQLMFQRQINGLLYGINRSEDKVDAFSELNVAEEVLYYIAEHAGLLKK